MNDAREALSVHLKKKKVQAAILACDVKQTVWFSEQNLQALYELSRLVNSAQNNSEFFSC